jgi:hypothetical protein
VCANAEAHWKSAEAIGTLEAYQDHLVRFPNCTFADLARARIDSLKSKVAVAAPQATPTLPTPQEPQLINGADGLSGDWQGYASIGRKKFKYEWHIVQEGEKISGTISISSAEGLDKSTYAFEGTIRDSVMAFRGTRWISPQLGTWCMASGRLKLTGQTAPAELKGTPELKGTWGANPIPGGCPAGASGHVQLARK